MGITLGTAPDSWGIWFPDDPKQTPWRRFLDEVAEAGFEWIELGPYGYLPTDLATLRGELDQRGIKVCACVVEGNLEESSPVTWRPSLQKQVLGGGELAAELGGQFMVLIDDGYIDLATGLATGPKALDGDGWKRLVDTTVNIAQTARDKFGLQLVFHPNAETHVETEQQIEQLLDETDSELVKLCLDLGHHAYCGGDPVSFLRKHHARMPHFHVKNVDGKVYKQVQAQQSSVGAASGMGVFCGPGEGIVDYEQVRDVLHEVGYRGFAIVEQDMYPVAFDKPLPIAKKSLAYLKEIRLGSLHAS